MLDGTRRVPRLARPDPRLVAEVVDRRPLLYREGALTESDRPAHVRAGSSIALLPHGLAIVQDDANFIAIVGDDGSVSAVDLPRGAAGARQFDDGRGNKRAKSDLEACFAVSSTDGTLLVALGSGSSPRREGIVTVEWTDCGPVRVTAIEGHAFFESLRRCWTTEGATTNVEGAVTIGDDVIRLLTRGTGRALAGHRAANATCDVDRRRFLAYLAKPRAVAPPTPTNLCLYDLGALDGIALGFTDATPWSGTWLYSATGEDTADAVDDGPVAGSVIGVVDRSGDLRCSVVSLPDGRRFAGKIEGIVADRVDPQRLLAVLDADEPLTPSLLCSVRLRGPWLEPS
jgi:hypothetical protein